MMYKTWLIFGEKNKTKLTVLADHLQIQMIQKNMMGWPKRGYYNLSLQQQKHIVQNSNSPIILSHSLWRHYIFYSWHHISRLTFKNWWARNSLEIMLYRMLDGNGDFSLEKTVLLVCESYEWEMWLVDWNILRVAS